MTQPGIRDSLGETSSIPGSTVQTVRATRGVDWADPVRGQFVVFDLHTKKVVAYAIDSENVELACNLAGVTGSRAHARARELLDRFGLGERLRFLPAQPSGGEQQRVAIARALANDPVCGMDVARDGGPHFEYEGTTWWFCSPACRDDFASDPNRFARRAAPTA